MGAAGSGWHKALIPAASRENWRALGTTQWKLTVTLPGEFEPLLTTWAATANISIDKLVAQLLTDALKIKRG